MKNLTVLFIKLNFEYMHSTSVYGYSECPTKYLGNLRHSEGIINPSDLPKKLYEGLKHFAYSSCEFTQPCFSNRLTIKELLTQVGNHSSMWYFFSYREGLLRCYYREDNREMVFKETAIYPWYVKKNTLRLFRQLSKYGAFVLGVDRLSFSNIFGNEIYHYI